MGKPEGKKALGRPRCRFEENIKIYLTETGTVRDCAGGRTEENHGKQDGRSPGRYLRPRPLPSEHKAGGLTTRPLHLGGSNFCIPI